MRRAILIVIDGLGVGEAPDAADFGDTGADTLGHVIDATALATPHLDRLGLRHTLARPRRRAVEALPDGCFGRLAQRAAGKDTTTGHWEMAGLTLERAFPLYPDGFPDDLMAAFAQAIGREALGNAPASGTEIIARLGDEHLRTGKPIVYTSGDSVFQIATHNEAVPLEMLYEWCRQARALLRGEHAVGRVIARPFTGPAGAFRRTHERRDFSMPPPSPTLLDAISDAAGRVAGIGKISDIFAGRGIASSALTESNMHGIDLTLAAVARRDAELVFTNLVDTDSKYGHRSDVAGYARCLEELDARVPELLAALAQGDLLILTGDHGCDPSDVSTDHTREFVPLIASGPGMARGADLGTRATLADIGATIAAHLGIASPGGGTSFLEEVAA